VPDFTLLRRGRKAESSQLCRSTIDPRLPFLARWRHSGGLSEQPIVEVRLSVLHEGRYDPPAGRIDFIAGALFALVLSRNVRDCPRWFTLGLALVGVATGYLIALSKSPVVGIVLPLLFGLIGGAGGVYLWQADLACIMHREMADVAYIPDFA
jgi:hypothetical protein